MDRLADYLGRFSSASFQIFLPNNSTIIKCASLYLMQHQLPQCPDHSREGDTEKSKTMNHKILLFCVSVTVCLFDRCLSVLAICLWCWTVLHTWLFSVAAGVLRPVHSGAALSRSAAGLTEWLLAWRSSCCYWRRKVVRQKHTPPFTAEAMW